MSTFALIALGVIVRGTAATVDGVSYLSMAEGLRHLEFTHWSGAQSGLWPYGYPAALATLGASARAMVDLGFVLQLGALAGVAGYLVLIARRLDVYRPSGAYLVGAAAVLASPAVVDSTPLLESEMLFTCVGLAFFYHVIVRSLLTPEAPRRLDLAVGVVAAFLLPNIRFIGVAAALGLAVGAVVLLLLRDPDARELGRRAVVPMVGGIAGTVSAVLINLATAGTLTGALVSQGDVLRKTLMFSAATFWQLLVARWHFPLFRYEVAVGAVVALVLIVLSVRTARAAWCAGDEEYRRFTVWTWSGIGAYAAILYWRAVTTLVDPISPRFLLPVLPVAVMWLVYSYVVASDAERPSGVLRVGRTAGKLLMVLWLAGMVFSVTTDLVRPTRDGDLSAVQLGGQDHACLARIADVPVAARISNNAALIWLATDGRLTAKQASYETGSPDEFYFIDTRDHAVGEVPEGILAGTTSSVLCSGDHLVVEHRTRLY
ncbi:hypothetical protein C6A87_024595 [Mycobacterium sp. ITM-2016-00317]|uniref:hypothetical protein n=1 Tax=Mycobacterium sp. ITM-2016-00317 TaxID=2099694 RepID=UPI00287F5C60|nr:hypothetical protein [Mycobacterium sp. ITM-2016-00317]WNG86937.1 hypothetical protein C6A87_024595 [Mycobacterium sp. ITM-2016-00317]